MTAEYIYKFVKACVAVYGTREPERIFKERRAVIKSVVPEGLVGMIGSAKGTVYVALDPALSEPARRALAAHLLGHAVLHRKRIMSGKIYEEPNTVLKESATEREADVFAAELLITDGEVLALRDTGMNEGQIVSSFGSLRDLAAHKLFSMRSRGIAVGSEICRADFLKRCDIGLFF